VNRNFGWDHREEILEDYSLESAPDSLLADMEALRIHDRFGISSWPQMIVMDPRTERVIGMPERTVESVTGLFETAADQIDKPGAEVRKLYRRLDRAVSLIGRGRSEKGEPELRDLSRNLDPWLVWLAAHRMLRIQSLSPADFTGDTSLGPDVPPDVDDPDPAWRAFTLERWLMLLEDQGFGWPSLPDVDEDLTRTMLGDEDIVVRLRAIRCLSLQNSSIIGDHAAELLKVPNDPFRYEVLSHIEHNPDTGLGPDLIRLFRGAGTTIPSLNPNVLRINTVRCLRESGDESGLEVLLAEVSEPDPRNYLHGLIVETAAEIAARGEKDLQRNTIARFLTLFPPALSGMEDDAQLAAQELRLALAFNRKLRTALILLSGREDLPEAPGEWLEQSRSGYLAELQRLLGIG